jgi:5-methyltetrahydropteroyltriglutamate--homocysteine methyltransferase
MPRTTAPFRADQVGSLLRTAPLKEARAKREKGEISAAELKTVEDREIEKIIRKQEEVGLQAVTDGEFRRSWWHFDFFWGLQGVEKKTESIQFQGVQTRPEGVQTTGKIDFPNDHPFLDHFRFVKSHTSKLAKMTIPSPSVLHFRNERSSIDPKTYPDIESFFEDTGKAYQKAVRAFYDAGCRYLQLDDTAWAYLCSPEQLEFAKSRGHDPARLQGAYAGMINKAVEGKPSDMVVTMHVCRGNFRSTWVSSGGYEPVAETIFGGLNIDGYFLEYDTERAGGFEPLRFVPKGKKQVVLGLVTSKSGTLENKDDIKKRIDEATKYVALDQLCLSPQCGFASTEEGNVLTEDAQWAKLREIVEIAGEVWG